MLVAGAVLPCAAHAQSHALGGKFGTTGLGVEYSYSSAELPMYGLRVNLNASGHTHSRIVNDVLYQARAEFRSLMLLADLHPWRGGFRASMGFMWNKNRVKATGEAVTDTVRINGTPYPSDAVENLGGELRFEPLSGYFGVGWGAAPLGRPGGFYSFDFGVLYQRSYVTLHADCGATLSSDDCASLQSDLRGQEARFYRDLQDYRLYPVITIGFGYRF